MSMIWVTRGRAWGVRFVHDGGYDDPLAVYEEAFSGFPEDYELCSRRNGTLAVRFPDPLGRRDRAGRLIPHEFVIVGPDGPTTGIESVSDGRRLIWPLVADEFARIWELPDGPEESP